MRGAIDIHFGERFTILYLHVLRAELHLPAMIFEDNSAVVTTTEENAYAKKCKPTFSNGD